MDLNEQQVSGIFGDIRTRKTRVDENGSDSFNGFRVAI